MRLDQRQPTGETRREALQKVAEATGRVPPELEGPELPPAGERIFRLFGEMSAGRSHGMAGPLPLSNLDILAWTSLTGVRLAPWELMAIRRLDDAMLRFLAESDKKEEGEAAP